jgi:hypothetical protein
MNRIAATLAAVYADRCRALFAVLVHRARELEPEAEWVESRMSYRVPRKRMLAICRACKAIVEHETQYDGRDMEVRFTERERPLYYAALVFGHQPTADHGRDLLDECMVFVRQAK